MFFQKRAESKTDSGVKALLSNFSVKSRYAESYRTLRTNLHFASLDKKLQVLLVTSALPGEGKSTTVANLARTMAQMGQSVLMVDADLRRPGLTTCFCSGKVKPRFGLSSLISETLGQTLLESEHLMESLAQTVIATEYDNLFLLPSGAIPPNPLALFGAQGLSAIFAACRQRYDMVIVDTSPVLPASDALMLSPYCDGALMIVQFGGGNKKALKDALTRIEGSGANVLGAVLNQADSRESSYYGYPSAYYGE
ncbi:CpsD/CapB family tyrosine-protein kinase [Desulfotalea psychrophila]|uniref:non-specific protein-tyrosine kinase n=1 Tax=Desulfotalea psychrophila (strain LSv54 / DSM 12343) TaxID=177439 RepID=Q6AI99_DESPS|nr:CpsD/CapB family tyrosine-protein kinase [Desulfotalea psychrophila]CAG37948.1 related to capsular polysaccharide biosynthesis protein [Desulfotalea psychrophila LSv54]